MTLAVHQPKSSAQERRDRVSLLFREAFARRRATVLICEGAHLVGMKRIIARLAHILDPRHYRVAWHDTDPGDLKRRPFLLPYWRSLPALGDLLILERSYYYDLVRGRALSKIGKKRGAQMLAEINDFERSLYQNDYRVMKIALDRAEKKVEKDYKKSRSKKNDPISLLARDFEFYLKKFDKFEKNLNETIEATNRYQAPWFRPPAGGYSELEEGVLNFLIARLEEDLDVNSLEEVKRFDDAMNAMRDRNAGAKTASPPPPAAATSAPPAAATAAQEDADVEA